MTKDEAIRLALTALENAPIEYDFHGNPMDAEFGKQLDAAVQALRQALEQPEQQPVAWWNPKKDTVSTDPVHRHNADCVPLYLYGHPPKIWQGLTGDEIAEAAKRFRWDDKYAFASAACWAEEKLREKNHG